MFRTSTKTWLAVAAALVPFVAAAEGGSVSIYGRADLGPLYQSNPKDGTSIKLNEISANRIGFIGSEDLGDGNSAFFRLEHRLYLATGAERSGTRFWTDKAWVGIKSKTLGALSGGRVLTVGNTIVGGSDFEAMTDSIGSINSRKGRIENNMDNGLFYESPWFDLGDKTKLRGVAQYTIPVSELDHPYSVGFQFRTGDFKWDAGYQHDVYKDALDPETEDRLSNSMFTGLAYDFGSFVLKGTFANSKGYQGDTVDHSPYRMRTAALSLNKSFGKWDLGLMGTRKTETSTSGAVQPTLDKFAVGYWYNFSKRTKFMPTIAYERLSGEGYKSGSNGYGENKDKKDNLYIQLGLRHEF